MLQFLKENHGNFRTRIFKYFKSDDFDVKGETSWPEKRFKNEELKLFMMSDA